MIPVYFVLFISSCTTPRHFVYMYDLKDSTSAKILQSKTQFQIKIQKNDVLSIRISSLNQADNELLNPFNPLAATVTATSGSGNPTTGYLVDLNGNINLPLIGTVKAEGFTRVELDSLITDKLKDFTKGAIVNVRFQNAKVSVLGDVIRPGDVPIISERLTILEALSDAGDMKVTGKRENVLVVREQSGVRTIGRIDLTSQKLFESPYFYLQSNDVVYVEPVQAAYVARSNKLLPYVAAAAGVAALMLSIISISNNN